MAFEHGKGARHIQDRFDSRRLADKISSLTVHDTITERDRDFIEGMDMFFIASQGADGNLDCSYKGGEPGFVRVLDDHTLAFPSYDGNGQFMTTGNILETGKVGMLFVDWMGQFRIRLNGSASIDFDDPLTEQWPGAQFIVRVTAAEVFSNCPRYIHRMELVERSRFVPQAGCETPDAPWKDYFEADLPADQQARRAARSAE